MKKEKSVGGLSVKAVVFSAIVTFFALLCATLVLSILALLNQKGKMTKATNGIAKALKILSMLTLIFVGLIGNMANVVLSFMVCRGYGAFSIVVYILVIIFTVILKNTCANYANKILPAKQEKSVEE